MSAPTRFMAAGSQSANRNVRHGVSAPAGRPSVSAAMSRSSMRTFAFSAYRSSTCPTRRSQRDGKCGSRDSSYPRLVEARLKDLSSATPITGRRRAGLTPPSELSGSAAAAGAKGAICACYLREDIRLSVNYFGVLDRKRQGGRTFDVQFDAVWPGGWRAVADLSHLTSLTFRLAFSPTFGEAVNSEVRSTAFVTNNFDGFSLNFAAANYKNFLSAQPETAVVLRRAPEVRFHAVDQAPWRGWPFYFGVDVFADAAYRSDTQITTPAMVQRSGFAPRMTIPLHLGPWPRYHPYLYLPHHALRRRTGQWDHQPQFRRAHHRGTPGGSAARPPCDAFGKDRTRSGNTPWSLPFSTATSRALTNSAASCVSTRGDTLTDTNEVEYSITQRLFQRRRLRCIRRAGFLAGRTEALF